MLHIVFISSNIMWVSSLSLSCPIRIICFTCRCMNNFKTLSHVNAYCRLTEKRKKPELLHKKIAAAIVVVLMLLLLLLLLVELFNKPSSIIFILNSSISHFLHTFFAFCSFSYVRSLFYFSAFTTHFNEKKIKYNFIIFIFCKL
jgi:hypothetical protein